MLKDAPGLSTATFELVMDGVLKLEAQVPERYAAEVKEGQDVQIHVDAYPDRVFTGKVVRINPTVDRGSRTFGVKVYVQNPKRELKAGGFAEVDILTRVDPQAWTVSSECVVTYAGSKRVFVVRDGKAHTISVETGIEGSGWVELIHAADADLRGRRHPDSGWPRQTGGRRTGANPQRGRTREDRRNSGSDKVAIMTLWDLCIRRPIFTVMLVSAPIVLGIVGRSRLGVDLLPNVELPIVVVTTTLKGPASRRWRPASRSRSNRSSTRFPVLMN